MAIGQKMDLVAGTDDRDFCIDPDPDAIYASSTPWKYNEEEIVKELLEYIRGTYSNSTMLLTIKISKL